MVVQRERKQVTGSCYVLHLVIVHSRCDDEYFISMWAIYMRCADIVDIIGVSCNRRVEDAMVAA